MTVKGIANTEVAGWHLEDVVFHQISVVGIFFFLPGKGEIESGENEQ